MDRLEATNTHTTISLWIRKLLSCRRVHSEWGTASMIKGAHRGTSQGGVLSPLLWNLVVDDLIKRFKRRALKITAYADDIDIIITGVCPSTLSSIMESTLRDHSVSMRTRRTSISLLRDTRYRNGPPLPRKLAKPG